MREQIINLVKCGPVRDRPRDRRIDVPAWIERGQVHVPFSVDGICQVPID